MPRPVFEVRVRGEPGVDFIRALRKWLKAGLRIYGLRCIYIAEQQTEEDIANKENATQGNQPAKTSQDRRTSMDMRKYAGEQYLKVDDVRHGSLLVQIAVVKPGKFDKPDVVFETGQILSLSVTNDKILVRAYGPDSDDWLGKEIELTLGQIEFEKKPQDAIIVVPSSPALNETERKAAQDRLAAKNPGEMNDMIPF
jgi:hypothetical protein